MIMFQNLLNKKGFTLIELMVTVIIIAILASIAVPSYNGYIRRGKMAKAYADIETVALASGRCYAERGCYGNYSLLTNKYKLSIPQTQSKHFTLSSYRWPNPDPNCTCTDCSETEKLFGQTYVIVAEPIAGDATSLQERPCLRSDGLRGYVSAGNSVTSIEACASSEWRGKK